MGASMQMFYINKLQSIKYKQHTYAIIRRFNKIINKALQHIFINNNHWIFLKYTHPHLVHTAQYMIQNLS
jgi:hypothetical protein